MDLLQNEKVVVQNNNFSDASSVQGVIYNHTSDDELIKQFKERIADLKKTLEQKEFRIQYLESQLNKK